MDYDLLVTLGHSPLEAMTEISEWNRYEDDMVAQLRKVAETQQGHQLVGVQIGSLTPGMVLGEPLTSRAGLLLVAKGQHVTEALCVRVKNHCTPEELASAVQVLVPLRAADQSAASRPSAALEDACVRRNGRTRLPPRVPAADDTRL